MENEPVSHYECKWVSENPIIPAWEDVDEIKETYERPPDHIGCLHCGIMNDMDETLLGKEIWQHYILNNLDTKDWQNYDGLRYIL
ncbi:MAG: hypothetical protein BRC27_01390 [Nanohaloarchaea archaeon SW_10_44_10]|nr:MAG: hypothetical protein BRC27_01390 [Nanohaloarchaea archaeon SW_10_44_10]